MQVRQACSISLDGADDENVPAHDGNVPPARTLRGGLRIIPILACTSTFYAVSSRFFCGKRGLRWPSKRTASGENSTPALGGRLRLRGQRASGVQPAIANAGPRPSSCS
jgi:hypothetical protein